MWKYKGQQRQHKYNNVRLQSLYSSTGFHFIFLGLCNVPKSCLISGKHIDFMYVTVLCTETAWVQKQQSIIQGKSKGKQSLKRRSAGSKNWRAAPTTPCKDTWTNRLIKIYVKTTVLTETSHGLFFKWYSADSFFFFFKQLHKTHHA